MSVRPAARWLTLLALLAGSGVACRRSTPERSAPQSRWSDEAVLAEGARYLDDPAFRRSALTASLTNPENTYSRQRLTSYGLVTRGWDALPEWTPRSVVLDRSMADTLRAGARLAVAAGVAPIWDGKRPTTFAGWASLGREVFFRYPLRKEVYVEWAVVNGASGERLGVRAVDDGSYPGVVAFVDTRGESQIGMTCAICHADVVKGRAVVGQARRAFDYGGLRLAYHEATKTFVEPGLARRMKKWGPGRADVTEDDDEDPVAVPDLWALRQQGFLTQAGTITHTGPTALAIRQETQLLTSNHQLIRPPRELAFALSVFLYTLAPPPAAPASDAIASARGKALFERQCASCHSSPTFGGDLVSAERVGTDSSLAKGGARGTGQYRVPALVRVTNAAPYFHQGAVATLEDVLAPERLGPGFAGGVFGSGPVEGHGYGTDLPAADRAALIVFLHTL